MLSVFAPRPNTRNGLLQRHFFPDALHIQGKHSPSEDFVSDRIVTV